jgi:hypothetical protein
LFTGDAKVAEKTILLRWKATARTKSPPVEEAVFIRPSSPGRIKERMNLCGLRDFSVKP